MQIKSVDELMRLVDFDVSKYDGLRSLNIVGWGEQLRYRAGLHWHLINGPSATGSMHLDDRLVKAVLNLLENPILVAMADFDDHDRWVDRIKSKPFDTYTVQSMVCSYVSWLSDDFSRDELRYVVEACSADDAGNATQEQEFIVQSPIDLAYQKAGVAIDKAHVVVDMEATDDQILADFSLWLKKFRKEINCSRPDQIFSDKDFESWIDSGAIPCIDLNLWELVTGNSITQNVLGQVIFPDEINADTTERIRRTTRPKAKQLVKESFSRAVDRQIGSKVVAAKMRHGN